MGSPSATLLLNMLVLLMSTAVAAIIGSMSPGFGGMRQVALNLDDSNEKIACNMHVRPPEPDD